MSASDHKPDPELEPESGLSRAELAKKRLLEPADTTPFWATNEFKRVALFGLILIAVGGLGAYTFWTRMKAAEEREAVDQRALAAPPVPADPALREQRLYAEFEGALSDTKNGDPLVTRQAGGYAKLLKLIASYQPEDVSARATRWLDYDQALADPDGWRGTFVRHRGLVIEMLSIKLETPILGYHDVQRGFMMDPDHVSNRLVFDMLGNPPPIRMNWEAIDVEGIFYRTTRFVDEGGQTQELPYLLIRNLKTVDDAQRDKAGIMASPFATILMIVGLALFLTLLLLYVARRRRGSRTVRPQNIRELFAGRPLHARRPRTPSGPH